MRSHGATGKCNKGPLRSLFMLSADRRGMDSAWERVSTHWVALISIEMGTLGPLRMSALIHTGLRILPASVSCRRRSREGPTALRLLKSSLMPAGKGQGLGNWMLTCWAERAGNSEWTALRKGELILKAWAGAGRLRHRKGLQFLDEAHSGTLNHNYL